MAMQAQLFTCSGLAAESGIDRRKIAALLARCPIADTKGRANCYWLKDAGPLIWGQDAKRIDLGEQRARQHRAMADKLERENQVRTGELVDGKEVGALWRELTTELRQRLMMIPARVGDQYRRAKRKKDAKAIIETEIRDALASLTDARAGLGRGT